MTLSLAVLTNFLPTRLLLKVSEKNNSSQINDVVNDCIMAHLEIGEELTISVNGNCMQPKLCHQDRVNVQRQERYVCGDIVAYYCKYSHHYLVHRMLGKIPFQDRYLIKADSARRPDTVVARGYILGGINMQVSMFDRLKYLLLNYFWLAKIASSKLKLKQENSRIKQG